MNAVEVAAAEVAAVCDAAGDRIERRGLAKGAWQRRDGSACFFGAIALEAPSEEIRKLTVSAALAHLRERNWFAVMAWSDGPATRGEVVQVFREIAASLRPQRQITVDVAVRVRKALHTDPRVVIPSPQREREAVAV